MNTTSLRTPNLTIRWMVQRDLPALLQIEEQKTHLRWTLQEFVAVLKCLDTAGCVAEVNGKVIGFMIYTVSSHPEIEDEPGSEEVETEPVPQPLRVSLLNLAVASDWHRRGIGRAMLDRFVKKLRQPEDCIQAAVPESNLPIQLLLRKAGYKAVRVLRGYYDTEDAYLMERYLGTPRSVSVPSGRAGK